MRTTTTRLTSIRPGMLVKPVVLDTIALFAKSSHDQSLTATCRVKNTEIGLVVTVVENSNNDPNILVMFGTRIGWVSDVWLGYDEFRR